MGSLLELAIAFLPDLADAVFITISLSMYSCFDRAPCGPPMTPSGLLGSLSTKPPLVLHHRMMHQHQDSCLPVITAWSIAPKLELALHRNAVDRHVASYTCTSRAKRYIKSTQRCHSLVIQE